MPKRGAHGDLNGDGFDLSRHMRKKLCVQDGPLDGRMHRQSPKRAKVARGDAGESIDIIFRGLDLNAAVEEFDVLSNCKSRKRRPSGIATTDALTVAKGERRTRAGSDTEQKAEVVVRGASGSRTFQLTARSVAQLIETLRSGRLSGAVPAPASLVPPARLGQLASPLPPECFQVSRRPPPFLPWLLREALAGLRIHTARIFVASRCGKVWQVQVPQQGACLGAAPAPGAAPDTPVSDSTDIALPEHALARAPLPCVLREVSEPDASLLEALGPAQACTTPTSGPVSPRLPLCFPTRTAALDLTGTAAPVSRPVALSGDVDADGDCDMDGCQ